MSCGAIMQRFLLFLIYSKYPFTSFGMEIVCDARHCRRLSLGARDVKSGSDTSLIRLTGLR